MATEKLKIVILADNKSGKAFKDASKDVDKLEKKSRNLGATFKKAGIALTAFGVVATLVGKKLIGLASDAEEIQSKFNVVFKETRDEMNEWADSFAGNVGRARQDIKRFVSGLGDILKPLGFATEEAGELSKTMVQLALDVASFNNRQDEDVIRSFTSALTGERESLKTLGIVISEIDVKNEAYSAGLAKQGEELSKTAKAQATMNLLFKNTADAQGDLLRTQDSFANKSKALSASLKDLGEILGNFLLPIATEVVGIFTNVVKSLQDVKGNVDNVKQTFDRWIQKLDLDTGIISAMKQMWDELVLLFTMGLKPALDELWIALQPLMPYFKAFGQVLGVAFLGALHLVILALRIMTGALTAVLVQGTKLLTGFIDKFTAGLEFVDRLIQKVIGAIQKLIEKMQRLRAEGGGSLIGGIAGRLNPFGGGRATGGPVQTGRSFLVGEKGPELFQPSSSGRIIPNGVGGGATIHIHNPVLLDDTMIDKFSEQIARVLRSDFRV